MHHATPGLGVVGKPCTNFTSPSAPSNRRFSSELSPFDGQKSSDLPTQIHEDPFLRALTHPSMRLSRIILVVVAATACGAPSATTLTPAPVPAAAPASCACPRRSDISPLSAG